MTVVCCLDCKFNVQSLSDSSKLLQVEWPLTNPCCAAYKSFGTFENIPLYTWSDTIIRNIYLLIGELPVNSPSPGAERSFNQDANAHIPTARQNGLCRLRAVQPFWPLVDYILSPAAALNSALTHTHPCRMVTMLLMACRHINTNPSGRCQQRWKTNRHTWSARTASTQT